MLAGRNRGGGRENDFLVEITSKSDDLEENQMMEKTVRVLCPNGIHISPAGVRAKLLKQRAAHVEVLRLALIHI